MDWYKRFPADFMVGTAHMTTEEVGAYQLLLDAQWDRGGRLPTCERKLARIARLPLRRFRSVWSDAIAEKFERDEGGYFNPRLDRERLDALSIVEKRREAANSRWNASASQVDMQKGMQTPMQTRDTRASLSLISLISEIKEEGSDVGVLNTPAFDRAWDAWIAYRKQNRWPTKPLWAKRQLRKLAEVGPGRAVATLEYSMNQGYQGIFPDRVEERDDDTGPVKISGTGYYRCRHCGYQAPRAEVEDHMQNEHSLLAHNTTGA